MQFLLDPAALGPPTDSDVSAWIQRMQELADLIEEHGIIATSAQGPRDEMLALWWTDWDEQDGIAGFELARIAEEISARVKAQVPTHGGIPLLDDLSITPAYEERRVSEDGIRELKVHLGEAACARSDGADHLGVLGPDESWSEKTAHLLVEGQIIAREDSVEELCEVDVGMREFLPRASVVNDVYRQCCEHPCSLMKHPTLGVRAFWIVSFDGNPGDLSFRIGPDFESSIASMNYQHLASNARMCLRVMTMIAAGRGAELKGHEERTGKGAGNDTLRVGGSPVMRAYISNRTPNAHRMFWIRSQVPVLLNVAGHEGKPAIRPDFEV